MTIEEVVSEPQVPGDARAVSRVLDVCDRVLEELGRRRHMFGWLRAPGAGPEEWLEVAAYYPSNRLVVVWRDCSGADDHLYGELVPAHGLRLLELRPEDFPGGAEAAELSLRRKIRDLGPPPRRASEQDPERQEGGVVRAISSLALHAEEARPARSAPGRTPARAIGTRAAQRLGMGLGVALVVVLLIEVYGGVIRLGFDAGRVILAFGFALDACARAMGTIAAVRSGAPAWSWWSAAGGSPVVASFALSNQDEPRPAEPAPLAGLISLLAIAVMALGALSAFA